MAAILRTSKRQPYCCQQHKITRYLQSQYTPTAATRALSVLLLTDGYRDIPLCHNRYHWIFCGWLEACYMRHIGKTENKIADCRNATVSDGV